MTIRIDDSRFRILALVLSGALALCAGGTTLAGDSSTDNGAARRSHGNGRGKSVRSSAPANDRYSQFMDGYNRKYFGKPDNSASQDKFGRDRADRVRGQRDYSRKHHPAATYYTVNGTPYPLDGSTGDYAAETQDQLSGADVRAAERERRADADKPRDNRMDIGDYRVGYHSYKARGNSNAAADTGDCCAPGASTGSNAEYTTAGLGLMIRIDTLPEN